MPTLAVRFERIVQDRLRTLSSRDLEMVRENVAAIRENPRCLGSHPSGLSRARFKAWQHTCPHSWVVLFRWREGDETHPPGLITIEDLVERY